MLKVIFSLDYEIHGNGEGSPYELMVEPTARLLRCFDQYGAKLTIMADIGEILCFKAHFARHSTDEFHYAHIVTQLQDAVRRGHDVQLHIHSSYFNAKYDGRRWVQDWSEYNFAGLSLDRMRMMVSEGKEFLESILRPIDPEYRCIAFRAANWSVSPSKNVVTTLLDHGIKIDTSVFKYGRRSGLVRFDYSAAHSEIIPWPASEEDLCIKDDQSRFWEFPIYSEKRWLGAFLTVNRVYRATQGARHRIDSPTSENVRIKPGKRSRLRGLAQRLSGFARRHAWKADFNQCTGRQLIRALQRAERKTAGVVGDLPFVLIGHSKLFNSLNERSLRPLLEFVTKNKDRFGFGTFRDFYDRIEHQNYVADGTALDALPSVDDHIRR